MAVTSEATTVWTGTLFEGGGKVALDSSGLATFDVNWKARAEGQANTTNPEELLAAALAFIAAFLNAAFGYCLGCQIYLLLVRARVIPRT